jgi:carboxypeptidase T
MDIKSLSAPGIPVPTTYKVDQGTREAASVPQDKAELAAKIDTNQDGVLTQAEIKAYMQKVDYLKAPGADGDENTAKLVSDYTDHLLDREESRAKGYHTYDQQHDVLAKLASDHPDRAELVSVGKSVEGRDIWALHISSNVTGDTSNKPGVVFTGCHHAREWMSMEVPLDLASRLVNEYDTDAAMKQRVDSSDIWVIPTVNPDGYEYSRTQDSWWRKNREPITDTGCSSADSACPLPSSKNGQPIAYGVDPNRNYWDGNPDHFKLYRPDGDLPCNTNDDAGVVSDSPDSDTYRGPKGGSEPEVQAMLNLELGKPNVKGVIDHHGYGNLFLRPWGGTQDDPPNIKDYDAVAARMLAGQKHKYSYEPAINLYPTTGTSTDMLAANGKLAFTIELGDEFQPDYHKFDKGNVEVADLAFLDYIIENNPIQAPAPAPNPAPPTQQPLA